MQDELKQLPTTVAEHSVSRLALPWVVPGNLVLHGDVVHAEIEAQGHIIANGSAEHCRLLSERGSVFLLYGSMAYTKIKAAINIYVKHSAESGLVAGRDIVIEKSVTGSMLRAGRKVISESGDASIVGGQVEAGAEVVVHCIGNSSGSETAVAVRDPNGRIQFTAIYPGVRLKIGDAELRIAAPRGAGLATLRDGAVCIDPLEHAVGSR